MYIVKWGSFWGQPLSGLQDLKSSVGHEASMWPYAQSKLTHLVKITPSTNSQSTMRNLLTMCEICWHVLVFSAFNFLGKSCSGCIQANFCWPSKFTSTLAGVFLKLFTRSCYLGASRPTALTHATIEVKTVVGVLVCGCVLGGWRPSGLNGWLMMLWLWVCKSWHHVRICFRTLHITPKPAYLAVCNRDLASAEDWQDYCLCLLLLEICRTSPTLT